MSGWVAKRFWDKAEAVKEPGGWGVALDGRRVRTPAKAQLLLPGEALAREVAAEWDAQEGVVNPAGMPFTRMANAAIDKVAVQQGAVTAMLAQYGATDLVCYRATDPQELVARQAEAWDPLIDWAGQALNARLIAVPGIMPAAQDAESLHALARALEGFNPFELAALHDLVTLPGSLVIGLACAHGFARPSDLWQRALVDELWQEEQWGVDEEAQTARNAKQSAFEHAHCFLGMCS